MPRLTTLASMTLAALLLGTSMASAINPIAGSDPQSNPSAGISDAVMSNPSAGINDAVMSNPEAGINDAVLNGSGQGINGAAPGTNGGAAAGHDARLIAFGCVIGDNDLIVTNKGDSAIPEGTKVRWEVRSVGARGFVQLNRGLGIGSKVRVAGVAEGIAGDTACSAKAMGQ